MASGLVINFSIVVVISPINYFNQESPTIALVLSGGSMST